MGNSAGKESRNPSQPSNSRSPISSPFPSSPGFPPPSSERSNGTFYSSRPGRGSRHDISIFGLGGSGSDRDAANLEQRRETKQEREARRLEKERVLRARERERSMRDEGVDGGYLVTLGTYVGPEDFSKHTVRKLQIERRLAPFWRGLNDHSSSWTEHQLVAAARGKPIPAPDEIPPQDESPTASEKGQHSSPLNSDIDLERSTSPTMFRTFSTEQVDPAAPGSSPPGTDEGQSASHSAQNSTPGPLFRGRAKTLASMTSARSNSQQMEVTPQELRLPHEPNINGQPIEAFLYKDVAECPICFLYYPTYLNQTRCCDQPICSECFVQIKRPDPHPPEHNDPNENPSTDQTTRSPDEDEQLVSEAATCPFCVQSQFGVIYDPPPFRRGLAYPDQAGQPGSSTSLSNHNSGSTQTTRRRGQSLSANSPGVITTDMVRPDWARKLSDARSHQARRSAAATALHTAAYMMNGSGSGFPGLGRRRRPVLLDGSGNGGHRLENMNPAHMEQMLAILEGQESSRRERRGNHDLFPGRVSSRGNRTDDLEEVMMMEAIRQSLAAEEERKKKEDKEAAKEAKKEEKKRAKEQKKADKAAKKNGGSSGYSSSANNSGFFSTAGPSTSALPEFGQNEGKGKAKASSRENSRPRGPAPLGFTALDEPSSVLHNQSYMKGQSDPQKHLEQSRANLGSDAQLQSAGGQLPRQPSWASSTNSSLLDSSPLKPSASSDSLKTTEASQPAAGLASSNRTNDSNASGFNFGSLAEMIGNEGVQMSDTPEESSNAHGRNAAPQAGSEANHQAKEGFGESPNDSPSSPQYLHEAAASANGRAGFGERKYGGNNIITSVVDEGSRNGETHCG